MIKWWDQHLIPVPKQQINSRESGWRTMICRKYNMLTQDFCQIFIFDLMNIRQEQYFIICHPKKQNLIWCELTDWPHLTKSLFHKFPFLQARFMTEFFPDKVSYQQKKAFSTICLFDQQPQPIKQSNRGSSKHGWSFGTRDKRKFWAQAWNLKRDLLLVLFTFEIYTGAAVVDVVAAFNCCCCFRIWSTRDFL